jgi:uncharacterized protein (DUF433 family)
MSTVAYPHIEIRADGKPRIAGTGFKVRVLVEEYLATGCNAHELHESHPQLSMAQIYCALAYYHDHKEEIDREIEDLNQLVEQMRAEQGESLFAKKLRERGLELP